MSGWFSSIIVNMAENNEHYDPSSKIKVTQSQRPTKWIEFD